MTTPDNTPENTPASESRPFGFWLTAVDRLTAAAFATAFEDEGITRRDWRILNVVDGTFPARRPLGGPKLRRLVELGWIARDGDGWTLTEEGVAAKARLRAAVGEIRAQVAAPLTEEEFAALTASLEKVARGLGWTEGMRLPRPDRLRGGRERHGRAAYEGRGHGDPEQHRHGHRGHGRPGFPGFGFDAGFDADGERFPHHPGFGREWPRHEDRRHHGAPLDADHCGHRGGRRHGARMHGMPAPHIHVHLHDRHDG